MKKKSSFLLAAVLGAWPSAAWAEPTAPAPAPVTSPLRTAGWYTAGGGVALLGASAVLFVVAKNDRDNMIENRSGLAGSSFDRDFTAAKILALAGAVGVATGVTFILVAPRENQVSLSAGLSQLTVSGTF